MYKPPKWKANVQKGARFKIQRENEARMLVRLTPPERDKTRASVLKNHLFILPYIPKLFQITLQCLEG